METYIYVSGRRRCVSVGGGGGGGGGGGAAGGGGGFCNMT